MKTTIETTEGKALVTFEGILDSYIAEEVGEQLVYSCTSWKIRRSRSTARNSSTSLRVACVCSYSF